MRLLVHPAAKLELDAALRWCTEVFGEYTAKRMLHRFDQLGQLLMRQPALGSLGANQIRTVRLGKFPYSLVYRVDGDVLTVLAVAHQSRRPGYWVGR